MKPYHKSYPSILNELFEDRLFFLNLDRREDRMRESAAEFEKHGMYVNRWKAVDGEKLTIPHQESVDGTVISKGYVGCLMSHLELVKFAKKKGLPNYVVFEDDVEFHPSFNDLFAYYWTQVPSSFDALWMGANHNSGTDPVSNNVVRMRASFTTHAFIVNASLYDALIDIWEQAEDKVDILTSRIHASHECYCLSPNLAFQRASFSDILMRDTDYQHLKKT